MVLLDTIQTPDDLKKLRVKELRLLAAEIRQHILEVTSKRGGHLASSLGVVELTIALHHVFDTPSDRIIWDVGHQAYAHKIITGRRKSFETLRTCGGISGFPKVSESKYDTYDVGHSSTSLSLALGEACARDLAGKQYDIIPVIGDGSMTGGMSFEALNQIGHLKKDLIIILNDNEHSISKNVGALSEYFTGIISGGFYNKSRKMIYTLVERIPWIGKRLEALVANTKRNIKGLILPGKLFEDLGIRYFGPVDGHNLHHMLALFKKLKAINNGPKIVHVYTRKGKGYPFAEKNPKKFHGISPFNITTGEYKTEKKRGYSHLAGDTLCELAKSDKSVIAITAAMTSGTGLEKFATMYPERFFDVGIAEQHAVTFSAALANCGYSPFFAVYSTFLQRGYDQLIHDVAIMKHPVTFLIDRSGVVGEDGETHHGLFDVSYLKSVPNLAILAPSNGSELAWMIRFAHSYNKGPIAVKYPRASLEKEKTLAFEGQPSDSFPVPSLRGAATGLILIAYGRMAPIVEKAAAILREKGHDASTLTLYTLKPLHIPELQAVLKECRNFCVVEDQFVRGGIAESILLEIDPELKSKNIHNFGYPDEFVCHASVDELFDMYGLSAEKIAATMGELL